MVAELRVSLAEWAPLHPAATAWVSGELRPSSSAGPTVPRSADLAEALGATNRSWGNPVDESLASWLKGAEVVVAGQQPGLLGGPMLTLVKACAVVAEVRRCQAAGRRAVGFLWLATSDDDLPEMGWARVTGGEDILHAHESSWSRGLMLGGRVPLGNACQELLSAAAAQGLGELGREAAELAAVCYVPGRPLGEATGRFLGCLLAGSGLVLVDALEPLVAVQGGEVTLRALQVLPRCLEALEVGATRFRESGWAIPVRPSRQRLPVFRVSGERREKLSSRDGVCPADVLAEVASHPERFVPNVWLRPFVQDAALGSTTVFLGSAELAYHLQAAELWPLLGARRPSWRLRPHVTVLTAAERRLISQLALEPGALLLARPPQAALPGRRTRNRVERLGRIVAKELARAAETARDDIPALGGDLDATSRKLMTSLSWLTDRIELAAQRSGQTQMARWRRLRAFARPGGAPQERALSALAPLLRLGISWPRNLIEALDPSDPGMHLLCWKDGGPW